MNCLKLFQKFRYISLLTFFLSYFINNFSPFLIAVTILFVKCKINICDVLFLPNHGTWTYTRWLVTWWKHRVKCTKQCAYRAALKYFKYKYNNVQLYAGQFTLYCFLITCAIPYLTITTHYWHTLHLTKKCSWRLQL